jgi:two-component system LytT family sensor kinase
MLPSKYAIPLNIMIWMLMGSLPLFFVSKSVDNIFTSTLISPFNYIAVIGIYAAIYHINTLYLIPTFLFQKRYGVYLVCFLFTLILITYAKPFDQLIFQPLRSTGSTSLAPPPPPNGFEQHPPFEHRPPVHGEMLPPPPHQHEGRDSFPLIDIVSIFLLVMTWIWSLAQSASSKLSFTEKKAIQAENDKVTAELSFLKAQINPHFLFNTLNNIYTLATLHHENTAPSIMKLSQIMRYVTDDVSEDFVPLEKEISCIENYIDLQRLRLTSKTSLSFEVEKQVKHKIIAPLILMVFVENVFKHAISNREKSDICIQIKTNTEGIHFYCQNTLFEKALKAERTGIGLNNTQKRLEYSYVNRHTLTILQENGLFIVDLFLKDS